MTPALLGKDSLVSIIHEYLAQSRMPQDRKDIWKQLIQYMSESELAEFAYILKAEIDRITTIYLDGMKNLQSI